MDHVLCEVSTILRPVVQTRRPWQHHRACQDYWLLQLGELVKSMILWPGPRDAANSAPEPGQNAGPLGDLWFHHIFHPFLMFLTPLESLLSTHFWLKISKRSSHEFWWLLVDRWFRHTFYMAVVQMPDQPLGEWKLLMPDLSTRQVMYIEFNCILDDQWVCWGI